METRATHCVDTSPRKQLNCDIHTGPSLPSHYIEHLTSVPDRYKKSVQGLSVAVQFESKHLKNGKVAAAGWH